MEDKYYKRTDVRINEDQKAMIDDISENLKLELDTYGDNESEVLRLAINIAYKNMHLIDKSEVKNIFNEKIMKGTDHFEVEFFINDIYDNGNLRTDLFLVLNFGYMELHRGIPIKIINDRMIRFDITSSNYFELDKNTIISVSIYNKDRLSEESEYSYLNKIENLKQYSYLVTL